MIYLLWLSGLAAVMIWMYAAIARFVKTISARSARNGSRNIAAKRTRTVNLSRQLVTAGHLAGVALFVQHV